MLQVQQRPNPFLKGPWQLAGGLLFGGRAMPPVDDQRNVRSRQASDCARPALAPSMGQARLSKLAKGWAEATITS